MSYFIDQTKCICCGACSSVCPAGAISDDADGSYVIDESKCVDCGSCKDTCPLSLPEQK